MQMQEVEIFGERKGPAFLTESIKTLNGKSCSPEVITTTIGSFICGALSWKLFLCSRAEEKGGEGTGWGQIYGSSCALLPNIGIPPHQCSQWRQKCSTPAPNIDIPACLFYCPTHCGLCPLLPDYCELFAFPRLDGFSSEKHCEWQKCLSFR